MYSILNVPVHVAVSVPVLDLYHNCIRVYTLTCNKNLQYIHTYWTICICIFTCICTCTCTFNCSCPLSNCIVLHLTVDVSGSGPGRHLGLGGCAETVSEGGTGPHPLSVGTEAEGGVRRWGAGTSREDSGAAGAFSRWRSVRLLQFSLQVHEIEKDGNGLPTGFLSVHDGHCLTRVCLPVRLRHLVTQFIICTYCLIAQMCIHKMCPNALEQKP